MSIYLDGMFYRCSGVGRVYENLLTAFAGHPALGEIHTIVPLAHKSRFLEQFPHPAIRPRFVGYAPMGVGDLVFKSAVLRSLRKEVGLYFFPGHNVPLSVPGRYIVSVNDVTVFSPRFELPAWRKTGFHFLVSRAVRGAEAVVTISETVKGDLVREFGLPPEKIRVIYPWVKEIFFSPPGNEPLPEPLQGKDYILYVGLRIAHKNVEGVLGAFLLLVDDFPELRLAIAGGRYTTPDMVDRWKADPRLKDRVIEFPDATDEDIVQLFSRAKAFVFPSFAEGFGLPPLEAMAAGVPVVCSDIPVFREVYGDAVCYVEPARTESIAAALRALLVDPSLSSDLRAGGKKQALKYRKDQHMERYLDLLVLPSKRSTMVSGALPLSAGGEATAPLVYIVVLTWNGREDTLACLRSLDPVWNERTRGIVVDNGSTDGTPDAVRAAFAGVEVLEAGQNLGFTGGNNIGLRVALDRGADYVLLLNNDTVVDPRILREMLAVATVSEEIGFVSPKIYFLDPPDLLWFAGARFSTVTGYGRVIGYRKADRGQYDHVRTIDRPCGCAVLVSRRLCREAGLMEDRLFLYADEVEWMLRARKHGFKACFAPKAKVWHKVSASVGRERHPDAFYYGVRNTLYALDTHVRCGSGILRYFRELSVTSVHLAALLFSSAPKLDGLQAIRQGLKDYRGGTFGKRGGRRTVAHPSRS